MAGILYKSLNKKSHHINFLNKKNLQIDVQAFLFLPLIRSVGTG